MRKVWNNPAERKNPAASASKLERPLMLIGFSYLAALLAAVVFGKQAAVILAIVCMALCLFTLLFRPTRLGRVFPVVFLTLAAAFFVFFVYHTRWIAPAETLAGADAEVSGTLCELPEARYGKYYYELDVDTIVLADAPHVSKLRFSSKRLLPAEPYDRITCRLHFYLPAKGEGYSSRAYYASKGIPILAYLNEFTEPQYEPAGKKPLYAYALQLRQKTENALFSMLPDAQAGLLSGVLLGDKSSVPEETIDDFRRVGASHLLAVSGLHLTALLAALMAFLRKLHLPEPLCAGICMMGVVVFMAVTGFTASVLRSGIMYLIFLFAQIVNRKADSLSSLGAAVLILCLRSPYAAADVGLLLSVMATLGMILFSARLQNWMKNWISPENRPRVLRRIFEVLISVLSGTLASLALTLPVTILLFGEVSLVAPVSNLFLLEPSSWMLELTAVSAILYQIPVVGAVLAPIFAVPAGWLASYMMWISRTLAKIPYASVPATYGFVLFWLAATALLAGLCLLLSGGVRMRRIAAVLSVCILAGGIGSFLLSRAGTTRIVIADTGSELCAVVSKDGEGVLIGCGGFSEKTAQTIFSEAGVRRLRGIAVLEDSYQEYQTATAMLEEYPSFLMLRQGVYLDGYTERNLRDRAEAARCDLTDTAPLWDDKSVTFLEAGKGSAVLLHTDAADILFCGAHADLSLLPDAAACADVLVCTGTVEHASRCAPAYTILSAYRDTAEAWMQSAGENSGWMTATGGEGDLVITLKEETYTIGRER